MVHRCELPDDYEPRCPSCRHPYTIYDDVPTGVERTERDPYLYVYTFNCVQCAERISLVLGFQHNMTCELAGAK